MPLPPLTPAHKYITNSYVNRHEAFFDPAADIRGINKPVLFVYSAILQKIVDHLDNKPSLEESEVLEHKAKDLHFFTIVKKR